MARRAHMQKVKSRKYRTMHHLYFNLPCTPYHFTHILPTNQEEEAWLVQLVLDRSICGCCYCSNSKSAFFIEESRLCHRT